MATTRVVTGTVLSIDGALVELAIGSDPDTGETLTVTAELPSLEVGVAAFVVMGDHGAVVIPAPSAGSGTVDPFLVRFDTYAELRDGITVPRAVLELDELDERI